MSLQFFVVYIPFIKKINFKNIQYKSGGKKYGKERHKSYMPLQRLSAKTFHTCERLVLTKTNLNLCKICVILTTSQKNKYDNMMHIIPRP